MKKIVENWVTLENPITSADLCKKLFMGLHNYNHRFEPNSVVHLFVLKKDELNRRVFFSSHPDWNKSEYVLVGKYKYHNFWSPPDAAAAFAETIVKRIKELEAQKNGNGS